MQNVTHTQQTQCATHPETVHVPIAIRYPLNALTHVPHTIRYRATARMLVLVLVLVLVILLVFVGLRPVRATG